MRQSKLSHFPLSPSESYFVIAVASFAFGIVWPVIVPFADGPVGTLLLLGIPVLFCVAAPAFHGIRIPRRGAQFILASVISYVAALVGLLIPAFLFNSHVATFMLFVLVVYSPFWAFVGFAGALCCFVVYHPSMRLGSTGTVDRMRGFPVLTHEDADEHRRP